MKDIEAPLPIRECIKDLNTKAYYLLVALGFLYRRSPGIDSLKWASTLTALVARSADTGLSEIQIRFGGFPSLKRLPRT
jgi:hypothetical protein